MRPYSGEVATLRRVDGFLRPHSMPCIWARLPLRAPHQSRWIKNWPCRDLSRGRAHIISIYVCASLSSQHVRRRLLFQSHTRAIRLMRIERCRQICRITHFTRPCSNIYKIRARIYCTIARCNCSCCRDERTLRPCGESLRAFFLWPPLWFFDSLPDIECELRPSRTPQIKEYYFIENAGYRKYIYEESRP